MDFKLNFLGVNVVHFDEAFHFFTQILGIRSRYVESNWAYLETTGMTFELFGDGTPSTSERDWGGIDLILLDPDGNPVQVVQYVST